MALDTQVVELIGRHRLIADLLRDGLEVATPVRDRGVDLIAYAELGQQVAAFKARPIQMKASNAAGFGVYRKYERVADLILAFVWHLEGAGEPVTYAMTYPQAVAVADAMGWTATDSWRVDGKYVTTKPGDKLKGLLEPHRMTPGRWWTLVTGSDRPTAA